MGIISGGGGGGGFTKPSQWTIATGGQLEITETDTSAALLELRDTSPADVFVVDADGGVTVSPQLHGTKALAVNAPATEDNGVATYAIGGNTVLLVGGNDNIGLANLHIDVTGNDGVQPLLNVGGSLGGATGLICAKKGASPAAGLLGFYGHAVATRPAAIPDAAGGAIIDAEARAALNTLLAGVRSIGLIAT